MSEADRNASPEPSHKPPAIIQSECPRCRQVFKVRPQVIGKQVVCKHCGGSITLRPKRTEAYCRVCAAELPQMPDQKSACPICHEALIALHGRLWSEEEIQHRKTLEQHCCRIEQLAALLYFRIPFPLNCSQELALSLLDRHAPRRKPTAEVLDQIKELQRQLKEEYEEVCEDMDELLQKHAVHKKPGPARRTRIIRIALLTLASLLLIYFILF